MTSAPDNLAAQLGIGPAPDAWHAHWPSFRAWCDAGKCGQLRWELPPDAAETFDLPVESLGPLEKVYRAIRRCDALAEMSAFWHYVLYHLPGEIAGDPSGWPVPEQRLDASWRVYALAMMVSGTSHARQNFAKTGVSEEVIRATLGYIGRYTRDMKERRGVWGLESIAWLRNYVRADIFRLGRLTFRASPYTWPYRAYRHRRTSEVITFCEPPAKYRGDGLADGTHGIHDPSAWTPLLELRDSSVRGCPVTPDHTADPNPVTLRLTDWELAMAPGDQRIEVHIAGGSRMPEHECIDAYRLALDFFPRNYPGIRFTLFTCHSWVLDPQLARILPQDCNIVRFQSPYRVLPMLGNERQTYDLVFGNPDADIAKVPRDTTVRRAIADYVQSGHRMRSTGAYMLWDDVIAYAR